ncbi:SHOCT domain-containing protein [Haloarcula salina]|uniref:SHOCT domain-containing protein n=1 Tax=Haloarcula salina TaxID=1429914 RepID=A0AA41FX84_9EURY|nr:SHOCT domain-containing protein [Haloarcula salina]MBV0900246.1 SHOCT domain-containing protein [Haloarcula salina]
MPTRSPRERVSANVTEIATMVVTGLWLVALITDQGWWLAALLVGYVVIVPLTEILFGDADDEAVDEPADEQRREPAAATDSDADGEAPLDRLRRRYAEGELTDEQFERKLERLLETETLEDAEDATRREREREFERN